MVFGLYFMVAWNELIIFSVPPKMGHKCNSTPRIAFNHGLCLQDGLQVLICCHTEGKVNRFVFNVFYHRVQPHMWDEQPSMTISTTRQFRQLNCHELQLFDRSIIPQVVWALTKGVAHQNMVGWRFDMRIYVCADFKKFRHFWWYYYVSQLPFTLHCR